MRIMIVLSRREPPAGRVSVEDPVPTRTDAGVPFTGWLGLLKVLSEVLKKR